MVNIKIIRIFKIDEGSKLKEVAVEITQLLLQLIRDLLLQGGF